MSVKQKILCLNSVYLPGVKAGGSLRTIVNIVEQLYEDFDFLIMTKDRDVGDDLPYSEIATNHWHKKNNVCLYYCSPDNLNFKRLINVIRQVDFDVLYLNSFFDFKLSIQILVARCLGMLPKKPILLAPRGEFSENALRLKWKQKKIFLYFSNLIGLHKGIAWQASCEHEKQDIQTNVKVNSNAITIVPDLPSKAFLMPDFSEFNPSLSEHLKIVFLSRICPMKNLTYALSVLSEVDFPVDFDIYGPVADAKYWQRCQQFIANMPNNVNVTYCGFVPPDETKNIFALYDLFLFPTLGENYGHVVAESLIAGTPVLISDKTPWQDVAHDGLGWVCSLDDKSSFIKALNDYSKSTFQERTIKRDLVKEKAKNIFENPVIVEQMKNLFLQLSDFKNESLREYDV